jgi:hypothetical protein
MAAGPAKPPRDKKGLNDVVHRVWFLGNKLVHQDKAFVGPEAWMIQQAGGLLGGAEAIGPQQDVLQFAIRGGNRTGVVAKVADGAHQLCGKLGHGLVELRESVHGGSRIYIPYPRLRRVNIVHHQQKEPSCSSNARNQYEVMNTNNAETPC